MIHRYMAVITAAVSLLVLGVVVACTTMNGKQLTPQQQVFQLKATYEAALTVAVSYKRLPSCDKPGAPKLCSDVAKVKELAQTDDVAFASISAAEKAVRDPKFDPGVQNSALSSAKQALALLTALTAVLPQPTQ